MAGKQRHCSRQLLTCPDVVQHFDDAVLAPPRNNLGVDWLETDELTSVDTEVKWLLANFRTKMAPGEMSRPNVQGAARAFQPTLFSGSGPLSLSSESWPPPGKINWGRTSH